MHFLIAEIHKLGHLVPRRFYEINEYKANSVEIYCVRRPLLELH